MEGGWAASHHGNHIILILFSGSDAERRAVERASQHSSRKRHLAAIYNLQEKNDVMFRFVRSFMGASDVTCYAWSPVSHKRTMAQTMHKGVIQNMCHALLINRIHLCLVQWLWCWHVKQVLISFWFYCFYYRAVINIFFSFFHTYT